MKTIRLFFFVLLAAASFGCSATDDPVAPQKPDNPVPEPEKTFKDINETMDDYADIEDPEGYYSYFLYQNDSSFPVWFCMTTKYASHGTMWYIRPGEQATNLIAMSYWPLVENYEILITDLKALASIDFFFNGPTPEELKENKLRWPNKDQDTLATYNFYEELKYNSPEATPEDPMQWTFEKFTDHRVRWTYRITDADHAVAVRQTLERWKDRPKEE